MSSFLNKIMWLCLTEIRFVLSRQLVSLLQANLQILTNKQTITYKSPRFSSAHPVSRCRVAQKPLDTRCSTCYLQLKHKRNPPSNTTLLCHKTMRYRFFNFCNRIARLLFWSPKHATHCCVVLKCYVWRYTLHTAHCCLVLKCYVWRYTLHTAHCCLVLKCYVWRYTLHTAHCCLVLKCYVWRYTLHTAHCCLVLKCYVWRYTSLVQQNSTYPD
jgi:hypothetical protein